MFDLVLNTSLKSKRSLREKCQYSEFFWTVFPCTLTDCISPYLVRMWVNMDQENSEYGNFQAVFCSAYRPKTSKNIISYSPGLICVVLRIDHICL